MGKDELWVEDWLLPSEEVTAWRLSFGVGGGSGGCLWHGFACVFGGGLVDCRLEGLTFNSAQ